MAPVAAPPAPPARGADLIGAMLHAFDPVSALATLTIAPSRALLTAELTAGGGADEPSAAEQAHILATWRAVLRASSAAEAQSAMLKLLGARLLGYCHEVRGRAGRPPARALPRSLGRSALPVRRLRAAPPSRRAAAGARLPLDGWLAELDAGGLRHLCGGLVSAPNGGSSIPARNAGAPCPRRRIPPALTPLLPQTWPARRSATLRAQLAECDSGSRGARRGRASRARVADVPADQLEWLATTFKSGWRASELERALLRTRLPAKLKAPPLRAE